MGEARIKMVGVETQQPVEGPLSDVLTSGARHELPVGPGTLREAFEHERRRASLLEQIVIDQLATMGLLLEEHTRQIKVLEAAAKPKSSIIKLHG